MPSASSTDLLAPINYVFVDFENVHEVDLSVIGAKGICFTLLLGAKQTKLDVELVEKLMEHAASVQLVRLTSSGKNALDFTLAYYVGRAAVADPAGHFHIISKDAGFDPLIQHLRSRHIKVRRHDDFSAFTLSGSPQPPPVVSVPDDSMTRVLAHLRKNTINRPKRRTTLASHLLAHLGKHATEAEVALIIETLGNDGRLSFGERGAVTYSL